MEDRKIRAYAPLDPPVVVDRRDRAAVVHPGPTRGPERTQERQRSPRSSGLASRNMSEGTMSAGFRPS